MKVLRNQAKKRPGLDFCDFRLERNSSEKPTFAQKSASYSNFGESKTRTRGSFLMKNELLARVSHLKKALKSKGPKVEREA